MKKSFLIARSNIKKSKGQTAAIIILMLIAAFMLNIWLMLSTDYTANFDRYHDKLNAEHVTLSVGGNSDEFQTFLSETIEDDGRASEYALDDCMHMTGTFSYNGGEVNHWIVFFEKEQALNRSIGRIEIVEDSDYNSGVYLPVIYKTGDIDIGKTIEISIGSNKETYTVCGFFNSIMLGSHNCGMVEIVLTEDKYTQLENSGYAPQATLCSVRLKDSSENLKYESDLKKAVTEYQPNILIVSNSYDTVAQARYISQMICAGIVSAMALFVLVIALVVIVSNIVNYIQVNMKNLGVLKAEGYTSGQLIRSLLLQFLGLTLFAAVVGIGTSYLLFPALNSMMIAQTGIPYAVQFLPIPLVITLVILASTVALAVWLASRKIKKIEPIVALRSGIQTHSFKRNHIPLEKAKLPLNFALALKNTLSGVKQNITICITMIVLTLVIVFSGLMYENVIADMAPFLNLIVGETADSCISVQSDTADEFVKAVESDSRAEKIYLFTSLSVSHADGVELLATISDDYSKVNNKDMVINGRFPKYDNEIALAAKYANENGFKVGDEIEITTNGKQAKYLICGFTQISNNLGRDCMFTLSGYERSGEISDMSYYINLKDNADIDEFNQDMKDKFDGSVNTVINIDDTINGTAGVYVSMMTIMVIAILVLSVIIITFVLYLLVRTMLNNKKGEHGVLKSLGFTTKQLVLQTALSFMPTIIISTAVGLIFNCIIINPLTALFLSSLGIVECTFTIPVAFITIASMCLALFAFAVLCLLSLKIKRVTPKALLTGE